MTLSTSTQWAGRSAHELAGLLAAGTVSSREVVAAHIARIERVDAVLNAVVVRRFDAALAEADAADAALARGEPLGPLHGVPVTVKESLALAGTASTFGLPGRRSAIASDDDPYVARLRAAGAVVLGKTNVAQLLIAYESVNPVYGRTNNPWRLDRTPGGSSGGEAAIIAAGGSALGIGSDILGSVRVPAAFCGLAAFKPTAGRTPDQQRGSIPPGQQAVVSQVGPIAGDVADVALALSVVTGTATPDGDPVAPLRSTGPAALAGLRIATWTGSPAGGDSVITASAAVARAVEEAAGVLADAGCGATSWAPPGVPDALGLVFGIMGADQGRGLRRIVGRDPITAEIRTFYRGISAGRVAGAVARTALARLEQGSALPTVAHAGRHHTDDYWRLVDETHAYRRRVASELDAAGVDLILSPVHAAPALPHGTGVYAGPGGLFAMLVNLLGYPAGVVPVTTVAPGEDGGRPRSRDRGVDALARADVGSAGLPVGVQVIGRPGRDDLVLAAMAAIEAAARTRPQYPRRADLLR